MGSGPSAHQNQDLMDHHHQYPDMNMIFRGIPKMIQVADDMHRMTDYIMDLRNMTIGLVIISVIGVCGFLLLRIIQGRSSRRRRQRSIMRHPEEAYLPPIRHYYQSQYAPEPWDRMKTSMSHQSQNEEKKSVETPMSTSESKPNGTVPYKVGDIRCEVFR
ncbi:unnamed protein product [Heligmosomoides polygyrus]|uniref:Conserved plasma membrane protein n=1 Tax=Heligmosomoides polygyrus TaxID=6339 RepID=A0A183FMT5_HELPZ|nr:unnamed protein product [Heligmosomoides polygyrus]